MKKTTQRVLEYVCFVNDGLAMTGKLCSHTTNSHPSNSSTSESELVEASYLPNSFSAASASQRRKDIAGQGAKIGYTVFLGWMATKFPAQSWQPVNEAIDRQ